MNEENSQTSTDSMTSQRTCFYSGCSKVPKWGISSSVERKDQDGAPLTLFACDEHEGGLTAHMRQAGTRYSLFPVGGPHMIAPADLAPENAHTAQLEHQASKLSGARRLAFNLVCIAVTIVITPFLLLYLGGKWMFGWRPEEEA